MTEPSYPSGFSGPTKNAFKDLLVKQEKIGAGNQGTVYRCLHELDGKEYAVKKVALHHTQLEWCLSEVRALSSLTHQHVVRYYESWTDVSSIGFESNGSNDEGDFKSLSGGLETDVYLFIQMEFCPSNLASKIKEGTINCEEALHYFSGLLDGLIHIHESGYLHRDLLPRNIFIGSDDTIKIGDFGLGKILLECFELNNTPFISSKVDVWSCGIMMYQMLFGRRPFGHNQTQEQIMHEDTIIKAHRVEFPLSPIVSSEVKEFIRRCLTYNQAERPDVLTMALDPYLTYMKSEEHM